MKRVVSLSSYEFMSNNKDKFDEKLSKMARNEACFLPKHAGMSSFKVNRGIVGNGILNLSPSLVSEIDAKWNSVIEPVTGYKTYDQLRSSMIK